MVQGAEADRVLLPREVADAAVKILAKQRAKPNFGNAGAATALLSRAKEVPFRSDFWLPLSLFFRQVLAKSLLAGYARS